MSQKQLAIMYWVFFAAGSIAAGVGAALPALAAKITMGAGAALLGIATRVAKKLEVGS